MKNRHTLKNIAGKIHDTANKITLKDTLIKFGEDAQKESEELYEAKKGSLLAIQELSAIVKGIHNCPSVIKRGISYANDEISTIKDAWDFERQNSKEANSAGGKAALGGMAAGGLTAAFGAPTAMAIATTFGTAATGTAISTLGGAAATNAALAWLGGGALAIGGGGVAGGLSVLALFGPLGASIAFASGGGFVLVNRLKNQKKIKEAQEFCNSIKSFKEKTLSYNRVLQSKIDEITLKDFNDSHFPSKELFSAVEIAKLLGKMSKEAINI